MLRSRAECPRAQRELPGVSTTTAFALATPDHRCSSTPLGEALLALGPFRPYSLSLDFLASYLSFQGSLSKVGW